MAPIVRIFALFALLLVLGLSDAFVPANRAAFQQQQSKTSLNFGFLKELGLEKPSWLPDFGKEKAEETPEPAAAAAEGDDAEAEDDAEPAVEE